MLNIFFKLSHQIQLKQASTNFSKINIANCKNEFLEGLADSAAVSLEA